jgi:hypothetical protein
MKDDDLRKRFSELKRSDAQNAPPFEKLVAKRPRARVPMFVAIAPVVAAAAVVLLWCGASITERKAEAPMAAARPMPPIQVQAAAELPLDFLLDNAPVTVNLDADPLRGLKP